MSSVVLLGAGQPYAGEEHSALRFASGSTRVLDWVLQAVREHTSVQRFVCGYQADAIKARYAEFDYVDNADWRATKAGWSLLLALDGLESTGCLVSYADIVFRRETVAALEASDADIAVAVDSHWRSRYSGRSTPDLRDSEKLCFADEWVTRLSKELDVDSANAEFIGLVRFSAAAMAALERLAREQSDRERLRAANLSDLVELLRLQGLQVQVVDVVGDWAQLNDEADLARFVLGTKAQTLLRLRSMVNHSRIEDQVTFTVAAWQSDCAAVLTRIGAQFSNGALVVRSSALSEDGFSHSNAGAYASILDVDGGDCVAVEQAIGEVVASYPDGNPANEVLVQPMLADVLASGVVFTRSLASGAPYYVVNYDLDGTTDSVTNGSSQTSRTLVVRRDAAVKNAAMPDAVAGLLPAVRELEALLGYDSLDVEFAVTAGGNVHILQVRPIAVEHESWGELDDAFFSLLDKAEAAFERLQTPSPFVVGKRTLFGVMPDWNPAEIIGTKPGLLATSLYRELIMDEVWAQQRVEYGYRDVRPQPLLVSFAGHPYVDIRASFNSFVPAALDDALAGRLVDFYLNWLESHPESHDKVEFDVIPTCFDLNFARWDRRLREEGRFSAAEVEALEDALRRLTLAAFDRNDRDLGEIGRLEARFYQLAESDLPPLDKACALLDDARLHGTVSFSHLARSAFIAMNFLRSAVTVGVLTVQEKDDFLASIRTVSHELTHDSRACAAGTMSWDAFVSRYGHLRPGTYDITSASYRQDPDDFLRPIVESASGAEDANKTPKTGALWRAARGRIAEALSGKGLQIDADTLDSFMRGAIEGREYAKFAFTRNLSAALDELAAWGDEVGVDRQTLSQSHIADLRSLRAGSNVTLDAARWLLQRAEYAQKQAALVNGVELPPLLCNRRDFSVFTYPVSHPNYIGNSVVIAPCTALGGEAQLSDLAGVIVLIPQADPGYDWLFGRDIAGLITAYGGANSHMAIRAAEFGFPAAIGVGEMTYQALEKADVLELNAANRVIRVVR